MQAQRIVPHVSICQSTQSSFFSSPPAQSGGWHLGWPIAILADWYVSKKFFQQWSNWDEIWIFRGALKFGAMLFGFCTLPGQINLDTIWQSDVGQVQTIVIKVNEPSDANYTDGELDVFI